MARKTFTIADSFDVGDRRLAIDHQAPLPLGYVPAVERAMDLRAKGGAWTYTVIATVMAEYHGIQRCGDWWKRELHKAGATPRPRGNAFTGQGTRIAA